MTGKREPQFVTSGRLAELAGVSRQTIHSWVLRGLIRPTMTAEGPRGRSIGLFSADAVTDRLRAKSRG